MFHPAAPRKPRYTPLIWALCITAGVAIGGGAALVSAYELVPAPIAQLAVFALVGAPLLWFHQRRPLGR